MLKSNASLSKTPLERCFETTVVCKDPDAVELKTIKDLATQCAINVDAGQVLKGCLEKAVVCKDPHDEELNTIKDLAAQYAPNVNPITGQKFYGGNLINMNGQIYESGIGVILHPTVQLKERRTMIHILLKDKANGFIDNLLVFKTGVIKNSGVLEKLKTYESNMKQLYDTVLRLEGIENGGTLWDRLVESEGKLHLYGPHSASHTEFMVIYEILERTFGKDNIQFDASKWDTATKEKLKAALPTKLFSLKEMCPTCKTFLSCLYAILSPSSTIGATILYYGNGEYSKAGKLAALEQRQLMSSSIEYSPTPNRETLDTQSSSNLLTFRSGSHAYLGDRSYTGKGGNNVEQQTPPPSDTQKLETPSGALPEFEPIVVKRATGTETQASSHWRGSERLQARFTNTAQENTNERESSNPMQRRWGRDYRLGYQGKHFRYRDDRGGIDPFNTNYAPIQQEPPPQSSSTATNREAFSKQLRERVNGSGTSTQSPSTKDNRNSNAHHGGEDTDAEGFSPAKLFNNPPKNKRNKHHKSKYLPAKRQ